MKVREKKLNKISIRFSHPVMNIVHTTNSHEKITSSREDAGKVSKKTYLE